jgi:hypothetical protein
MPDMYTTKLDVVSVTSIEKVVYLALEKDPEEAIFLAGESVSDIRAEPEMTTLVMIQS